jgi:aminoglycoside phosphotransferase (APT) family kinase protein
MNVGTPAAEIEVGEALARALLQAQHPDLARLPIRLAESGWDNVIFRLGEDLALRIPRREVGADLVLVERRWLPGLAARLPLPVPAPVRAGEPGSGYPWPWSVTPWFEGTLAALAPPGAGAGEALAAFLKALHVAAPAEAPFNPFRSVTLAARAEAFEARLAQMARAGETLPGGLLDLWGRALAEPVDAPRVWRHGDLHGRNVLTHEGRFAAVLDWGDMSAGDPATDLAGVWMLLPERAERARAMAAYGGSEATWRRARGWALMMGVFQRSAGLEDDPGMAAMGREVFDRLLAD